MGGSADWLAASSVAARARMLTCGSAWMVMLSFLACCTSAHDHQLAFSFPSSPSQFSSREAALSIRPYTLPRAPLREVNSKLDVPLSRFMVRGRHWVCVGLYASMFLRPVDQLGSRRAKRDSTAYTACDPKLREALVATWGPAMGLHLRSILNSCGKPRKNCSQRCPTDCILACPTSLCSTHGWRVQGLKLSWVGHGRDTFTSALFVQLRESGLQIKGVTLPADAPEAQLAAAEKQLRLLVLRFIAANQHLLKDLEGAEQQLKATALCFKVRITCLEVTRPHPDEAKQPAEELTRVLGRGAGARRR